jgi:hypothetical protein
MGPSLHRLRLGFHSAENRGRIRKLGFQMSQYICSKVTIARGYGGDYLQFGGNPILISDPPLVSMREVRMEIGYFAQ